MAATFNYQNGSMRFDFVLRIDGGVCKREGIPDTRIGGDICRRCCWYNGSKVVYSPLGMYTLCKKDGAEDEGSSTAWSKIRQELYHSAMCALDY